MIIHHLRIKVIKNTRIGEITFFLKNLEFFPLLRLTTPLDMMAKGWQWQGCAQQLLLTVKASHIQRVFLLLKKYGSFVTHYFQLGNWLLEDCVVNCSKTSVRVVEKHVNGRNLFFACVNKTTLFNPVLLTELKIQCYFLNCFNYKALALLPALLCWCMKYLLCVLRQDSNT